MIQVLAEERHAFLAICDYFYHRGMPVKPEASAEKIKRG
jgi:hypothetical protein